MAYDKERPNPLPPPFQSPGQPSAPQQPSTLSRAVRIAGAAFPTTVLMLGILVVLNFILPESIKPTTLMGTFMGHLHVTETLTQQDTVVENTRRTTDATAGAQAQWQLEIIVFQKQMDAISEAMQGKIQLINVAEWSCNLGPLGIQLFYGSNTPEGRDAAQLVRQACAFAARGRQEIVAEQAELARLNSAIMQRQNAMKARS